MVDNLLITLIGLGVEATFGWPEALHRRIGHPVSWLGKLIKKLETNLNNDTRIHGVVFVAIILLIISGLVWGIEWLIADLNYAFIIQGVIAATLLASRSLYDHVKAVGTALRKEGLTGGQERVAMIVGRDVSQADEVGVSRAAIESLAENTSDGVVAPLFYGVLFGLPGLALYKAINTMDSMVGHLNARYRHFGWCAARLDDVANFVPARLTGALFCLVSRKTESWAIMFRDAGKHRSVNAGWPESAMAAGIERRLSGPRRYGDVIEDAPWLNANAIDPRAGDIDRGLRLYLQAMACLTLALLGTFLWQSYA